ncbi:hypothetical protein Y1Q_0006580 [Alligator mississippiensis]|uniref:Uncharacterized protein n=1 Tax=Alligator mississippiensis TaxID=8496 RepID=A0A151NT52_ALLMI|nr:hypothetical protein Y1Q_0006580 [Alligator mississippiensis]
MEREERLQEFLSLSVADEIYGVESCQRASFSPLLFFSCSAPWFNILSLTPASDFSMADEAWLRLEPLSCAPGLARGHVAE